MKANKKQLQALLLDIKPGGKIHKCIEAGFIKGSVTGDQATAIKDFLTAVVEQNIEQQTTINQLQEQLNKANQLTAFA